MMSRLGFQPSTARPLLVLLLMCATAFSASAHQDRLLSIAANGSIPELPPQYASTRIQIEFAGRDAGKLTRLMFTSAGKTTEIGRCVLEWLPPSSLGQVSLSGSWYHTRSTLPHYVSLQFRTPGQSANLPAPLGISFLFSLEDAKLLELQAATATSSDDEVQLQTIDLKDGCPVSGTRAAISPK